MTLSHASGAVVLWRWLTISPSWVSMQTYMLRACSSMPQSHWCCVV
jgi:hypothetical protein